MDEPETDIEAAPAELEVLCLTELREQWRRRWGATPALRSVRLVRQLFAWRRQAEAFGGLTKADIALLQKRKRPARLVDGPLSRGSTEERSMTQTATEACASIRQKPPRSYGYSRPSRAVGRRLTCSSAFERWAFGRRRASWAAVRLVASISAVARFCTSEPNPPRLDDP